MTRLSTEKILLIKEMRRHGYSILEISAALIVPKTTVHFHSKNVLILSEFEEVLFRKRGGSIQRMQQKEEKARILAKTMIPEILKEHKLLFIAALYWAEGNKKDFILTNTDPRLINLFIKGLRTVLDVEESRIQISIRIFEDLDKDKCLEYWSEVVNVPKDKFVNVYVLPGKKVGKLKYGMCRIRVKKGADLLKYIRSINDLVYQYMSL